MTKTVATQLCPNPKCGADNPANETECPKCQTIQRQLLGRGTILQGRYRIENVRGCGGFGAVYRAIDLRTGGPVAIKENHQHRTFQRFEREAKLLKGLNHPNLPKVHEVFQDATTGQVYLVMDFVNGETLEEIVQRKGALSWQEAEPIFAQIVNALTYLHNRNIFHRDIKPSNIIVTIRTETVYEEVNDWEEVSDWQEVDDWQEVVVPPPSLDEGVMRNETDYGRFERGWRLWRQQRLTGLQREGWQLSGVCWSEQAKRVTPNSIHSAGKPDEWQNRFSGKSYRVSVELQAGQSQIGRRYCECADFRRQRRSNWLCKHLVALLLAWIHEPKAFQVVAEKIERRPVKKKALVKKKVPIKRKVPRQVHRQHAVLVDFGVAKVMEAVDPNRPRSSSITAWTDGYSPPEQYLSGREVDAQSDQYALAATMVFVLTGQTPDDAFTRMEKSQRGKPNLPPKPSNVPDRVWQAIQKAMHFDSRQRFETIDAFQKAFQTPPPTSMPAEPPSTRTGAIEQPTPPPTSMPAEPLQEQNESKPAIGSAIWGAILVVTVVTILLAISGVPVGEILGAIGEILGAILFVIWFAMFAICGAISGAILVAIWGLTLGAILNAIFGEIWGVTEGAILGAIYGAILGAILGAIYGAILGAIYGAILGAILGAIFGAIFGANWGAKGEIKR